MSQCLKAVVNDQPMRPFQYLAVGVCIVLNMIDGFDVLVMAFTASSVASEWGLNGAQVGMLLSAGLFGMAAGSLFIAPWADRFGRRPLIMFCLVLSGIGMLLSAHSQTPTQLALLRALTGLGIGGILASSNVIASEYANKRWRGLAVSLQSTGYALGATFGGLLSVWLLTHYGWRSVFTVGGWVTLATLPVVMLYLPESLDFLLAKRPAKGVAKLDRLAVQLGQPAPGAFPAATQDTEQAPRSALVQLLNGVSRRTTLLLWALFFLVMFGFYFIMSWTPKLLVSAGLSAQQGVSGGVLLSVGGIVGATLIGLLASRWRLSTVLSVFMLVTAGLLVLFACTATSVTAALALGLLIGLASNACVAGLYALSPMLYGASVRATGVGWGIGIGRIGAILSPTVAGLLLDGGWQPLHLYGVFAVVFVIAAAALLLFLPKHQVQQPGALTQA
ncbi:benzoate transport [Pseudomonas hunanensis]|uniref:Benzoate transport n=1 Tax=Pseudomonas hunanensis TaxID=1247546 RepID=A0ACC6JZ93_9PSED|nr:MFS transporter [Pseudomonas hunanensis]MDR6711437.1 benzoate transport [Pseudomonas hunanensis]